MPNSRAILQIDSSEQLLLTLQENTNGALEWHFPNGSGSNRAGRFSYVTTPVAQVICYDNNSRVVMILHGVPARPRLVLPFLMQDQPPNRVAGELDVMGAHLPLRVNTYDWSVRQVVPSA